MDKWDRKTIERIPAEEQFFYSADAILFHKVNELVDVLNKIGSNPVRDGGKEKEELDRIRAEVVAGKPFLWVCKDCGYKWCTDGTGFCTDCPKCKKSKMRIRSCPKHTHMMFSDCPHCQHDIEKVFGLVHWLGEKPRHCDKCTAELSGIEIRFCDECVRVWVKSQNIGVGDIFQPETCPKCKGDVTKEDVRKVMDEPLDSPAFDQAITPKTAVDCLSCSAILKNIKLDENKIKEKAKIKAEINQKSIEIYANARDIKEPVHARDNIIESSAKIRKLLEKL